MSGSKNDGDAEQPDVPSTEDTDTVASTSTTNSTGSSDEVIDNGELALLSETLFANDNQRRLPNTISATNNDGARRSVPSLLVHSAYGQPIPPETARRVIPSSNDGLIWHCTVIPDDFCVDGKLTLRGLNARDFDLRASAIKPRRPSLPVTVSNLFSSLTKVEDEGRPPRYIFSGILNGWPSLKLFELIEINKKRSIGPLSAPDYLSASRITWQHYWSVDKEGKAGVEPTIIDRNRIYRAKLRGPDWTSKGWSVDSPGFVFWYEAQRQDGPRVTYGTNAVESVEEARCTHIHMMSHRYAVAKESTKNRVTYHSVVLLEWDHGRYCTVVEGAYLNGIGGYQGKSNWYRDRDECPNKLYQAFPPEMISPWLTSAAEIRCFDVEAKNLDEFKDFVYEYEGADSRFVDPHFSFSHPARLTYRSKSHIAQYCLNYIGRDTSYSELKRNCQTLAADLCSFLAGKKDVAPFHPVNRIDYHNRTYLFLYDSDMYNPKKNKSLKGKVVR